MVLNSQLEKWLKVLLEAGQWVIWPNKKKYNFGYW